MKAGTFEFNRSLRDHLKFALLAILSGSAATLAGINFSISLIILSAFLFVIYSLSKNPVNGIYYLIVAAFFSVGLTRYINAPLGLLIDFILLGIFIFFFLKKFRDINWSPLKNTTFFTVSAWMMINIAELGNPEANSFEAWFFAMRGVSLYFFLTVMLGFLLLNYENNFNSFITLWFTCSVIATLWGMKQLYVGLDNAEKAWLAIPGNMSTHMLFGKLRVFSFYSDAGQFGAAQAHTALVASIMAINEKIKRKKYLFAIVAVLSFYGMLISGTRGAFAIPVVGFFAYLLLIRNWKIIIAGIVAFILVFGLLKFTSVGQGIYEIQRLRSSLNPNDASFQVRLENQRRLAVFLDSHPLGGGVGSAGYWGLRFSPNTFLANLALDSWYVRIAAEYGYALLIAYLGMLISIVIKAIKVIKNTVSQEKKNQLIALFCGLSGILVASYGNQVFGQLPTAILIYISIVFITKTENGKTT